MKEYSFRGVVDLSVVLPLATILSLDQEEVSLTTEGILVSSKISVTVATSVVSSDSGVVGLEVMELLTSNTALAITRGGVVLGGRPFASPSSNGSTSGWERVNSLAILLKSFCSRLRLSLSGDFLASNGAVVASWAEQKPNKEDIARACNARNWEAFMVERVGRFFGRDGRVQ